MLDERTQTQGDIICEQVKTLDMLVRKCKIVESLPNDLLRQVLDAVAVIIKMEDEGDITDIR